MSPHKVQTSRSRQKRQKEEKTQRPNSSIRRSPRQTADEYEEDGRSKDIRYRLNEQWPSIRKEKLSSTPNPIARQIVTQEEIKPILSRPISKVIETIPRNTIIQILQRTRLGPHAQSSEISLECTRARIRLGHNIRIIGPDVAEQKLKVFILLGRLSFA
jgi:hypothetical protein